MVWHNNTFCNTNLVQKEEKRISSNGLWNDMGGLEWKNDLKIRVIMFQ